MRLCGLFCLRLGGTALGRLERGLGNSRDSLDPPSWLPGHISYLLGEVLRRRLLEAEILFEDSDSADQFLVVAEPLVAPVHGALSRGQQEVEAQLEG